MIPQVRNKRRKIQQTNTSKAPHIKQFQTKHHKYIYDVHTSEILQVDDITYDIFSCSDNILDAEAIKDRIADKYPKEEVECRLAKISGLAEKESLFSTRRPHGLKTALDAAELKKYLDSKASHLILNVTEDCNLRCKYCIYSGTYKYHRTHNNRFMDPSVAKKAIDFFATHSIEADNPCVGFYGGEPLLDFRLIQECAQYIKTRIKQDIFLSLTSNGVLINEEVAKFFIEYNVSVTISLDGPEEINDRFRVDKTGKGSFKKIIRNLRLIQNLDAQYYASNISFNIVYGPPYQLLKIYEFFSENKDLFYKHDIKISHISYFNTNFFDGFDKAALACGELYELEERFLKLLGDGYHSDGFFLDSLFEHRLMKIYKRGIYDRLEDTHFPNKICVPGMRRLFVDVNGKFYICEKLTSGLSIGDVDNGFDYNVILELIGEYCKISADDCCNCWAIRLCGACFISASTDKLDINQKRAFCQYEKRNIERDLVNYCSLLEKNPSALDYMKKIVIR